MVGVDSSRCTVLAMARHVDVAGQSRTKPTLLRHTLATETSSPFLRVFREDLPPVSTNGHSDCKPAIPRSKAICCAEWRTASETFDRCWGCRSKYLKRSQQRVGTLTTIPGL
uniref:Uncharacterized protein n=1 Tax=Micrurus carvalhoi TaxID=3147026 RepID=A0A2H6NGV9_9SAUR